MSVYMSGKKRSSSDNRLLLERPTCIWNKNLVMSLVLAKILIPIKKFDSTHIHLEHFRELSLSRPGLVFCNRFLTPNGFVYNLLRKKPLWIIVPSNNINTDRNCHNEPGEIAYTSSKGTLSTNSEKTRKTKERACSLSHLWWRLYIREL